MELKLPERGIVCDKCENAATDSEDTARAEGWKVDVTVDPHKHFCPDCL